MPAVPAFMLKKLYLRGSLKNTEQGFQFQIRNTLAPGTITAVEPVVADGAVHPVADILLVTKDTMPAAEISKEHPVVFGINTVVTMIVKGAQLAAGEHTVVMGVQTKEAGELKWDVTDTVA
jgi:hydroxymethylglutaryl-CoA reductase (NADPH)